MVHSLFVRLLSMVAKESPEPTVGGQAIIEGVMMRSATKVSWAVRKPDKTIAVESLPFVSLSKQSPFWRLPLARGAVSLFESLILGYKILMRSAELALEEGPRTDSQKYWDTVWSIVTLVISFLVSIGLFMYLPMWVASLFFDKTSALPFNTVSGIVRILIFLSYLFGISFFKDVRRLFEYHGAEHKVIAAHEAKKNLTFDEIKPFSTHHPRCGTSFLFLVGFICIFLFSIIDALVITFIAPYPNILSRMIVHLALVPLVGGTSYEVLKFSASISTTIIGKIMVAPGLWLQNITTREPSDDQIEIAVDALKASL